MPKVKNVEVKYWALVVILITFCLLLIMDSFWIQESVWRKQVYNLLLAIQSTAIITAFWEYLVKKTFADDIIQKVNISMNLQSSGVEKIESSFQKIDWQRLLKNTHNLSVAISYGATWRKQNRDELAKIASKGKIAIYLPNYNDENVLQQLAYRFSLPKEKIKEKIIESATFFAELQASVYLYKGVFTNSYYLLDNTAIMSFFNHKTEQSTVPALEINNEGTIYEFITEEINAIHNNSIQYQRDKNEK